ncbi:hypothetical protein DRW41_00175 [Neobacillus piezotolerans]|uniref:Uncharacterized protein n=1 Tax=Neobacillus piezotolerans TaxID=2259171 RepID=A0A3D8GV44_9BACI|nr:hypothetical protein [Neobacillus piezotolerans]RDU38031.1 hypothetical protein DRW41_00175 [Neobacillus piezotolerans]
MISKVVSGLMGILFYRAQVFYFSEEERREFEKMYLIAATENTEVNYTSKYPKHRFIQYIAATKPVILHGSNNSEISEFEARRQTLYNGQIVNAVFGTKDGIWPLFYAVLDKKKVKGGIRNACLKVEGGSPHYFFSLNKETLDAGPWTTGMIYFLPGETFKRAGNGLVSFDEWVSETPVKPIAKVLVEPYDFLFLNSVSCHKDTESIVKSWLLYRLRTKGKNRKIRS